MKKILLFLLGVFLFCLAVVLGANYFYFNNGGGVQIGQVSGQADSDFIAETVANSDYLEFFFTPKEESAKNYYINYILRENDKIIDSAENELRPAVSKSNPIFLGVSRQPGHKYSLEMKIGDKLNSDTFLHDDKIVIQPLEIKEDN